jgi:hypothetical protein
MISAGVISLIGFAVGIVDLVSFQTFSANAVKSTAVVVAVTPEIHRTFSYRYTVQANTYTGTGLIDRQKYYPSLGARIPVTYNSRAPSESEVGDINASHRNEMISRFGIVGLLVPALLLLLALVYRRGARGSIS